MNARGILGATVAAAIAAALASCHGTDAEFSIGGSITGTTGTVVLKLNGANDITQNGDGNFKFAQRLVKDDTFNVQVIDANDRCLITNGAGVVAQQNITNVSISCGPQSTEFVVRSAVLNGSQQGLAVTTTMTGIGGIVVNPNDPTNITIDGGITLQGISSPITQINILLSPTGAGVGLPPLVLAPDGVTAVLPAEVTLSSAAYNALLSGLLYFNVATAANANGEIRGTIELQGGLAAGIASLDQLQVVPPSGSANGGGGVLLADHATGRVLITYIAHTALGATRDATGIRVSASSTTPGAGSAVLDFGNLEDNYDGAGHNLAWPPAGAIFSQQNLADFDNSKLFFNVTSAGFPAGEIRGNIIPLPQ